MSQSKEGEVVYRKVSVKDRLPKVGSNVAISYDDGQTFSETADYLDRRTCMLAGVGGGNGYFGRGFASDGSTGCDRGLILDEPTHWLEEIPASKLIEDSMPSEEEINKIFPITGSEDDLGSSEYIENELMRDGIKWLKTKLTNKK